MIVYPPQGYLQTAGPPAIKSQIKMAFTSKFPTKDWFTKDMVKRYFIGLTVLSFLICAKSSFCVANFSPRKIDVLIFNTVPKQSEDSFAYFVERKGCVCDASLYVSSCLTTLISSISYPSVVLIEAPMWWSYSTYEAMP